VNQPVIGARPRSWVGVPIIAPVGKPSAPNFDYQAGFGRRVKIINGAAMQALGSYRGGKMLFLGLGTGLGSTLIVDGIVEPMELGHVPYRKGTYEDYLGQCGLEKRGKALEPDDVVLGGGNVRKLKELPPGCRAGDNANAFVGGFRLWEQTPCRTPRPRLVRFHRIRCSTARRLKPWSGGRRPGAAEFPAEQR
jgi:hypothetical protein